MKTMFGLSVTCVLVAALGGCSGGKAKGAAATGDLKPFQEIAEDTLKIIESGDLQKAKARIKDLETDWDNAEEVLKPMNPSKWTSIDKSIDRALAQLRSGSPDAKACKADLETLIEKLKTIKMKE